MTLARIGTTLKASEIRCINFVTESVMNERLTAERLDELIRMHEKYSDQVGTWQAAELMAFRELRERRNAEKQQPKDGSQCSSSP